MSFTTSAGGFRPNAATFPMFSLMMDSPAASFCFARSSTGPRMSYETFRSFADFSSDFTVVLLGAGGGKLRVGAFAPPPGRGSRRGRNGNTRRRTARTGRRCQRPRQPRSVPSQIVLQAEQRFRRIDVVPGGLSVAVDDDDAGLARHHARLRLHRHAGLGNLVLPHEARPSLLVADVDLLARIGRPAINHQELLIADLDDARLTHVFPRRSPAPAGDVPCRARPAGQQVTVLPTLPGTADFRKSLDTRSLFPGLTATGGCSLGKRVDGGAPDGARGATHGPPAAPRRPRRPQPRPQRECA